MKPSYDARHDPLVVGRTPLLPVSTITAILAAPEPLNELRRTLAESELIRTALTAASPTLAAAVDEWARGAQPRNATAPLRALAYVNRMATRATPFGMCAGIGYVSVADGRTTLRVDEGARRTCTRADMGLMHELIRALESGDARGRVAYSASRAAIQRGDRLYVTNVTLTSYESTEQGYATAQVPVSLKFTDAVRYVLDRAQRLVSYEDLTDALARRFGEPVGEARRVLDALIESGLLISELRVSPVGDPLGSLRSRISRIDPPLGERLEQAFDEAARWDVLSLEERTQSSLTGVVEQFGRLHESAIAPAVQVDMHVPFEGALPAHVLGEVERLAEYQVRFSRVAALDRFRARFLERYEGSERLVPLLELVDPNLGLGLPEPLRLEERKHPRRDALLTRLACEALVQRAEEVALTDEHMARLAPPANGAAVPASAEFGFQVAAESYEALDRGDYRIVPAPFFATNRAARGLGRFAHLFDAQTRVRIISAARYGLDEEALTAELSYAPPSARAYNVMIRPAAFDAVIPVAVATGSSALEVTLDDLWAGLDGGRFFLWSQSRGCRVIPVESHVFDTDRGAPNVCRFLASLAADGRRAFQAFDWGPARGFTYLPRIRIGKLVLAPRQWRFERSDLGAPATEFIRDAQQLRTTWAIPRYAYLTEGDNRLLLDFDASISYELLYDQCGDEAVTLVEALPDPSNTWTEGRNGRYAVEFVASVRARRLEKAPRARPRVPRPLLHRRSYGLGSEWVYAKLYLAKQAMDDFIVRALTPAVHELAADARIDCWFFLRYADPQTHLRMRLRAAPGAAYVHEYAIAAAQAWLREGRIVRYAFDTYEPEYERYGGVEGVARAERFFAAASERCAECIVQAKTVDARIAVAAESFAAWVTDPLHPVALRALQSDAHRKLQPADREALKRIASLQATDASPLQEFENEADADGLLRSFFHMHCNRLGLEPGDEMRAATLLRALLLSRSARGRLVTA